MSKRKKIVPKWRKWETESSREPWRDTEKTSTDEAENETAPRAESRRCGGYTVAYLREKNDLMQKWKMEDMQLQKQRLESESKKEEQWCRSCCSKLNSNKNINRTQHWKSYSALVTINGQTTVLCKRNANEVRCFAFFVLAKIRRSRILVESREISLSSCWNFASTEANVTFVLPKFSRSENWHPRNCTIAITRTREIPPGRNFHKAKFRLQWKRFVKIGSLCTWYMYNCLKRSLQIERSMMLVIVKPTKLNENESFHTALSLHWHIFKRRK